tara:strand:- start:202 stop:420 length:219 start_codon:yes stop_codon:yes gene_type:complete
MKKWDGCDEAIVGEGVRCGQETVLVYDYNKLIKVFVKKESMSKADAIDWIDFNILGAWLGEDTPILLFPREE